jgi:hypothetical protein
VCFEEIHMKWLLKWRSGDGLKGGVVEDVF